MRGDLNTFQVQAAPPPGGLGLGRAVETRASLARTGAATALYRSSRPHYTAPGSYNSGHPSAAETPTQMVSQAVRDQRYEVTAHASEARGQFTTNSGEPFTSPRRVLSCVETRQHQPVGLVSVGLRQFGQVLPVFTSNRKRSEFAPTRQNHSPDRFAKESVGGFHRLSSVINPVVGAFA